MGVLGVARGSPSSIHFLGVVGHRRFFGDAFFGVQEGFLGISLAGRLPLGRFLLLSQAGLVTDDSPPGEVIVAGVGVGAPSLMVGSSGRRDWSNMVDGSRDEEWTVLVDCSDAERLSLKAAAPKQEELLGGTDVPRQGKLSKGADVLRQGN